MDHLIFFEDGEEVGPLIEILLGLMDANMPRIIEQTGLASIGEDTSTSYELQVGPPWVARYLGEERALFVRWEEGGVTEFHPIQYIVVGGRAEIQVSEVSLTHRRLGEVMYAHGEGTIRGDPRIAARNRGRRRRKGNDPVPRRDWPGCCRFWRWFGIGLGCRDAGS